MKKLFILRHALTFPASGLSDRERALTPEGIGDARNLGDAMKQKNYVPDFVFCSPVTRTRQTLENVLEALGTIETQFKPVIYEGGYPELVELVQGAPAAKNALLLVGHNPSIHQFAANMAGNGEAPLLNNLTAGYPPGTLTVLGIPGEWRDLTPGENKLIDLI